MQTGIFRASDMDKIQAEQHRNNGDMDMEERAVEKVRCLSNALSNAWRRIGKRLGV